MASWIGPSRTRSTAAPCPFCAFGHEPGFEHAAGACIPGGPPTPPEGLPDLDPAVLRDGERLQEQSQGDLAALGRLIVPLVRRPGEACFEPGSLDEAQAALAELASPVTVLDDPALDLETGFVATATGDHGPQPTVRGPWDGDQISAPGLRRVIGHGAATPGPHDLLEADLVLLLGLGGVLPSGGLALLEQARRRGARVVEVCLDDDPPALPDDLAETRVRRAATRRVALLEALAGGLFDEEWHRPDVLHQATTGWQALRDRTTRRDAAPSRDAAPAQDQSSDAPGARALLEALARAERQLFVWGPRWTGPPHDLGDPSGSVAACARLALLSEAVGRPGTGLLPLPSHPADPCLAALGGPWPGSWPAGSPVLWVGGDPRGRSPLGASVRDELAAAPRRVHLAPVLDQACVAPGAGEVWCLPTSVAAEQLRPGARVGALRGVIAPRAGVAAPRGVARAALDWLLESPIARGLPTDRASLRRRMAEGIPALAPLTGLAAGGIFRWGGERLGERRHFPTPDGRAWLDPRPRPPETPRS